MVCFSHTLAKILWYLSCPQQSLLLLSCPQQRFSCFSHAPSRGSLRISIALIKRKTKYRGMFLSYSQHRSSTCFFNATSTDPHLFFVHDPSTDLHPILVMLLSKILILFLSCHQHASSSCFYHVPIIDSHPVFVMPLAEILLFLSCPSYRSISCVSFFSLL